MKNYTKTSIEKTGRTELHDALSLTGAEVSINNFSSGTGVPFVHSHKENEEIYIILSGKGTALIDGEMVEIKEGDALRLSPKAERQFRAAPHSPLSYICIQIKENSLTSFTQSDAVIA